VGGNQGGNIEKAAFVAHLFGCPKRNDVFTSNDVMYDYPLNTSKVNTLNGVVVADAEASVGMNVCRPYIEI
jgi:hypothetical protein